ncbi:high frequency lysogenization protein HflD [Thermomonas sp. HDW16]|uniref:high frequency lysogenization protein HflD n=1 Tax=Thermomonas sp. HDW16 TaxID=2714945 RepID=UPI00140B293B|nr:high frequency lysogenization protein HflD [Thermomonas sp. HDW16]QIL20643.1 high frequency lysogenization protein HflD [Thermomonas sp. HDW16]
MSGMEDRVLALGGMLQALAQVRRIADTGQSESTRVQVALDSVFRIDAPDTGAVYGDIASVRGGLRLLRDYLANTNRDEALGKLGLSVLNLEHRFSSEAAVAAKVGAGIESLSAQAERLGSTHPDVVAGLGSLYADTVSTLRPRVMVQGNPHYLGQAGVVAEIRALLLAALRSAVLWRQSGGSLWDFLFRRREMAAAIDSMLG